jgi:hypothetical protein
MRKVLVARPPSLAMSVVLLLACSSKALVRAQAPDGIAAYYTDVCYHPMTGDVLGDRLTLLSSPDGYTVKFQLAEGELGTAIEGKAAVSGDALTFELNPKDGKSLSFKGRITPEEVTGQFSNGRLSFSGKPEVHWRRVAINEFTIGLCKTTP